MELDVQASPQTTPYGFLVFGPVNPSGELSENLLQDTLLPVTRSEESPAKTVAAAFELLVYLRLVADPETNYHATTLEILAEMLSSNEVKPLAEVLVSRLERENSRDALQSLRNALLALRRKLDKADSIPITETMLQHMRQEHDAATPAEHAWILGELSKNLDAAAVRPITDLLLDRLKTQKDEFPVIMLTSTLAEVAVKSKQVAKSFVTGSVGAVGEQSPTATWSSASLLEG